MNAISYPDEWDPEPGSRVWFSHFQTGDRGWRVRRAGKWCIHLDRKDDPIRAFREGTWIPMDDVRPMSRAQVAEVAFQADRALCRALGIGGHPLPEWLSLHPEKRRVWIETGPKDPPIRRELYQAVMGVIRGLSG